MSDFQWPSLYNFPPFFTLQKNADSRSTQVQAWCNLILAYARHSKLYQLDVQEALASPLFKNTALQRQVHLDMARVILDELASKGNVEWLNKEKSRCRILWRTPEQWASLLYTWVQENGLVGSVCTLFELQSGENAVGTELHGVDEGTLRQALSVLEKQGKAQVFSSSTGEMDGVKFF